MSNIVQFPKKLPQDSEARWAMVVFDPECQIFWNRGRVFYIHTEVFKVDTHVVTCRPGLSVTEAQQLGRALFEEIATEYNRRLGK